MATHAYTTPTPVPGAPPTRRLILSAFTGAAFAGTAVVLAPPAEAAENPDAELLAVIAEFTALEAAIYPPTDPANPMTIEREEAWEETVEPLHAKQRALLDRMCGLPTHTLDGFRARARLLTTWTERFMADLTKGAAEGYWPEQMQVALFRDLTGEVAA